MVGAIPITITVEQLLGTSLGQTMNERHSRLYNEEIKPASFQPRAAVGGIIFVISFHDVHEAEVFGGNSFKDRHPTLVSDSHPGRSSLSARRETQRTWPAGTILFEGFD